MSLPLELNKSSGIPVYFQLEQQLRLLIHQGLLGPGDVLPTVRQLAVDLGVNSNTIARVYRDLQREDLLVLQRGVGTTVADTDATRSLRPRQLKGLVKKVDQLVELSQTLRLSSSELCQLIRTRWKEQSDASR